MKPLFFLYVWLNLTRIAELRKESLVKHIRKITIQTGRLFFSYSLIWFIEQSNSINPINFINLVNAINLAISPQLDSRQSTVVTIP